MRGRRALGLAALATAATTATRRGLRKSRVLAYPPGPDAITDDIALGVAIEYSLRSTGSGGTTGSCPLRRASRRASNRTSTADATSRACSRRSRRDHIRAPAHLRLPARRDRLDFLEALRPGPRPASRSGSWSMRSAARPTSGRKALFADLSAAGISIVANDGLFARRAARWERDRFDWHMDDFITSTIARCHLRWPGRASSGGRHRGPLQRRAFYDAMCRMSGPVVGQLQPLFLATSATGRRGRRPRPAALDHRIPTPETGPLRRADHGPRERPRDRPSPDQRRHRAGARGRDRAHRHRQPVHLNRAILVRLLAAAQRGVTVRLVAPGHAIPPYPAAVFRHCYARLMEAGVRSSSIRSWPTPRSCVSTTGC